MRRPVLPSGPGAEAPDERSHFGGHKQSSLDVEEEPHAKARAPRMTEEKLTQRRKGMDD
jgi:hypothetical protein